MASKVKMIFLVAFYVLLVNALQAGLPPGFDLEAHRGGRDARPENSLYSFAFALAVGVTTPEMDMQITADGHLVIAHNPVIPWYRAKHENGDFLMDDESIDIRATDLKVLKTLELGFMAPRVPGDYFQKHGKTQKPIKGTRICTLDEVFQLVRDWKDDKVYFNIETKSYVYPHCKLNPNPKEFVRKFLEVVKKYGMENRVMLQSFDWRTLVEMKKLDPSIPTVALTAEQPSWNEEGSEGRYRWEERKEPSPWMAGLNIHDFNGDYVKAANAIKASVVSPYYKEVTPALVEEAHKLKMKMIPWTVNNPEDMRALIKMGVDGIISDRPTVLRSVLMAEKVPVPDSCPCNASSPYFSGRDWGQEEK